MVVDFVLAAFACWRVTSLIVNEDGPFDIFAKFRRWVGVRFDERSNRYGENIFAKALICVWCTSVWVAIGFALLINSVNIRTFIINWLSLSAATIFIDLVVEKTLAEIRQH